MALLDTGTLIPFDATLAPFDVGPSVVAGFLLLDLVSTFSPPPGGAFTLLTPVGDLAADPDIARWTPVLMNFTVPPGFNVTVVAQIGDDSALWMVAYDEKISGTTGAGALAPLFSTKSTAVVTGTIAGGRSFAMSILPNGGWQRETVKLVPYSSLEIT